MGREMLGEMLFAYKGFLHSSKWINYLVNIELRQGNRDKLVFKYISYPPNISQRTCSAVFNRVVIFHNVLFVFIISKGFME